MSNYYTQYRKLRAYVVADVKKYLTTNGEVTITTTSGARLRIVLDANAQLRFNGQLQSFVKMETLVLAADMLNQM